jgi:copper(I)-binding protein
VFSLVTLSGCAAGNDAPTLQVKPDNAATSVGDIMIQNGNVITVPEGEKGPAVVAATIFNQGTSAETLQSIKLKGDGGSVELSPANGSGPLTIPAGGSLQLGGEGNASAVIANATEAVRDGDAQQLVFAFDKADDIELTAFVVPATSYFETYGPQSASPSGAPATTAKPTE